MAALLGKEYADTVGEPLVGVTLTAELVADKVAYVYLHIAICCYADGDVRSPGLLPIP